MNARSMSPTTRGSELRHLRALDALEQRPEVAFPEPAIALALDQLEEERAGVCVLDRLHEDLQQVADRLLAIDQDLELLERREALGDRGQAEPGEPGGQVVIVRTRGGHEANAAPAQRCHRADQVVDRDRRVLQAAAALVLAVAIDLRRL